MSDSSSLYASCARLGQIIDDPPSDYAILQCIANEHEVRQALIQENYLEWGLTMCGSLVFFMQAGFAALCAGSVRKKNLQNTMLKNVLDACTVALSFYVTGYALAFGVNGAENDNSVSFSGQAQFFTTGNTVSWGIWFFQYACASAAVTIVAGTLAERCKMASYILYSIVLSGFVYPIVVHAVWSSNGFLSVSTAEPLLGVGAVDFAGTGVVHLTGGWVALVASIILGPRKGRFHSIRTGEVLPQPKNLPGHSLALQVLGGMVLWFGWFGFNPGSALLLDSSRPVGMIAAKAALNTGLAAAFGSVSAMTADMYWKEKETGDVAFNINAVLNGLLAGLVAITSGCGTMDAWAAALTGIVAGWCYLWGHNALIRVRIDDVVDGIPVHLVAAIWGLIATGLFSTPSGMLDAYGNDSHVGWFYEWGRGSGSMNLLFCQLVEALFIIGWTTVTMGPFFYILYKTNWFRTDQLEELLGMDKLYHDQDFDATETRRQLGNIRQLLNEPAVDTSVSSH